MAPVEPEILNSNAWPLFLTVNHVGIITFLVAIITRFILRSHSETPPALHTRRKHTVHKRGITLFATLTALSLLLAAYHALVWRYASYQNWAQESGVDVPNALWEGWYANSQQDGGLIGMTQGWQLGRWMKDTNLLAEINAAQLGEARGFWWTYQNFVGLVVWSIFVGIEGRHRNIPQSITIAFVLLAQLASLSTAQNLFNILLLVTPLPIANGAPVDAESHILAPHPAILSVPALLSYIYLYYLPWLSHYGLYTSISTIGYFAIPILLATLAQPNALHKVKRYNSTHEARKSYEDIFRVLSLASFSLHMLASYKAITEEAPPHRYFRHNFVWNMHQKDENTRFEQAWTVLVRIMGALSDNPVISQVGWDVILSVLTLCIWTVSHSVDAGSMLRSSGLSWSLPHPDTGATKRKISAVLDDIKENITVAPITPGKRPRGRPRKTSAAVAKDHIVSPYSTALTNHHPDGSPPASPTLRRSTRNRTVSLASNSKSATDSDSEYMPTKATQAAVARFDFGEPDDEGAAKETEAAALGWGLFAVGGLGVLSAGVLGADCAGR